MFALGVLLIDQKVMLASGRASVPAGRQGVSWVRASLSGAPARGARRATFPHPWMHAPGGKVMSFTLSKLRNRVRSEGVAHRGGRRSTSRRQRLGSRPTLERLEGRLTPSVSGPPFDFSNSFYLANGIDPSKILNRVGSPTSASAFVVDNSNTNPDRTNIRITETTGGFKRDGNVLYYTINGFVTPGTFTKDAAGQKAMQIAENFEAYIFPKASGDPLSPALSNRRQDNVFDTKNGYFTNNPLGLWTAVFVSYTPAAFNTAAGQQALAALAAKNGKDLDGTPIIKTPMEVDGLERQGFAVEQHRNFDGSQGFPWII